MRSLLTVLRVVQVFVIVPCGSHQLPVFYKMLLCMSVDATSATHACVRMLDTLWLGTTFHAPITNTSLQFMTASIRLSFDFR